MTGAEAGSHPTIRPRTLVVTPTINEGNSIGELIKRLFAACDERTELLVVDDASSDGTGDTVAAAAAQRGRIHLIRRDRKLGLGSAYVLGFAWGMERGFEVMVEMDGDLSHDPAAVPRLVAVVAGGADLVIGSRYVPGGKIRNWGRARRLLSRAGNRYARAALRYPVMDSTSGLRAYSTAALGALDLATVNSEGYAFQIELTRRAHRAGLRIVEEPITFVERAYGRSKLSRGIVVEALLEVSRWGLADRGIGPGRENR